MNTPQGWYRITYRHGTRRTDVDLPAPDLRTAMARVRARLAYGERVAAGGVLARGLFRERGRA